MRKFSFLSLLSVATLSIQTTLANDINDDSIVKEFDTKEQEQIADFTLQTFKSCQESNAVLNEYIKKYWNKNKQQYLRRGDLLVTSKMQVDTVNTSQEMLADAGTTPELGAGGDFSETNTQVKGVDESDTIKTDGTFIYSVNEKEGKVFIYEVATSQIIKTIEIPGELSSPTLYVDEKTLSIVSSGYARGNNKTYLALFDIDHQVKTFSFRKLYTVDGSLSSSRKIGDKIYLISQKYFSIPYYSWASEDEIDFDLAHFLPKKIEAIKGNADNPYSITTSSAADCNEIEYSLPTEDTLEKYSFNPSFVVVSVVDTSDKNLETKTKVIAGSNAEIHMSQKNLYLTENMYSGSAFSCPINAQCIMSRYSVGNNTVIHKMNLLEGGDVSYQDSTLVPGSPLTQYSMDEYDGYFRILTQTNDWSVKANKKYTGLYILDSSLALAGKLENLGNNENFKSSRYIGDKLYLVTFRDVDPFFVIDVKDPKNPAVLGELKIPGYSTYLHPYDENHIIGLGYNTSDNGHGGVYNDGLKVDLYKINYNKKCGDENLSEEEVKKCESGDYKGVIAKQIQSKAFGQNGSHTEALYNPRMFMWNAGKNMLFLPAELRFHGEEDKYEVTDFFNGMMAIKISPEGIEIPYKVSHIDMDDIHEKRVKACEPYLKKTNEKECVKLLNGEEYCGVKNQNRVPSYCFADATDAAYIGDNSWEYQDDFVKRALWIGESVFAISDSKISTHDISTGDRTSQVDFISQ